MLDKIFFGFLVFVPLAAIASVAHAPLIWVFFISALAIVPLSRYIGEATDHLARRAGVALGGLLNATFGNAPELIIGIFALKAGLIEVVKASITGSIIGNILLVMGASIFAGGLRFSVQKFNKTAVLSAGSTLVLAVAALITPALFLFTTPSEGQVVIERLSFIVALIMIVLYVASLIFSLHTHKYLYAQEIAQYREHWSIQKSLSILILATLAVSWMSEILVSSIEPVLVYFGWTQMFIGVIVIAVIGNAAEHTSAILVAVKDRMDLAMQIALGSATQIALLVAPILVLTSFLFPVHVSLVFGTFELATIVISVLIANLILEDGESNWFEGLQLLAAYAIMAVAFFFHA